MSTNNNTSNTNTGPTAAPRARSTSDFFGWGKPAAQGILKSNIDTPLQKLKEICNQLVAPAGTEMEWSFVTIPNDTFDASYFSMIVICGALKGKQDKPVMCIPLVLENTAAPAPARKQVIDGVEMWLPRLPYQTLGRNLYDLVRARVVAAQPQTASLEVLHPVVIPRHFNWSDPAAVYQLSNGVFCCLIARLFSLLEDHPVLSLANMSSSRNLTKVKVGFHTTECTSIFGAPVRSDIMLDLVVKEEESRGLNTRHELSIGKVSGFIDFRWLGNTDKDKPTYAGQMVITSLTNERVASLEGQLLMLATATVLSRDKLWQNTFVPTPSQRVTQCLNIKDIGALTFEDLNEDAARLDTQTYAFDQGEVLKLLDKYVLPNIAYAIDVEDGGVESSLNDVFVTAAEGSSMAVAEICRAANALTGGIFGEAQKGDLCNTSPVSGAVDHIYLGTYTDAKGRRVDVREIDYLAMLNLQDLALVHSYSRSFNDTQCTPLHQLHQRDQVVQQAVGKENVTLTGTAKRVSISADFLTLLINSCYRAGLLLEVESNVPQRKARAGDQHILKNLVAAPPSPSSNGGGGLQPPLNGLFN